MRVATLATRFSTGGAELNSLLVANELRLRGFQTESWFLMREGDLEIPEGHTARVASEHASRGPVNIIRSVRRSFQFASEFKPDVIIGFQPLANIIGAMSARRLGACKFIGTQRNPSFSQGKWTGRIESALGATRLYSLNIAVTAAVAETYGHYSASYREKIRVVHNGAPPLANFDGSKDCARSHLGLPRDVALVGTIGRLADQKNPLFLIECCRDLDDVHLVFAGGGPLRAELAELAKTYGISHRVHFTGQLRGVEISAFYKAIDIFLLPSNYEGFGRTLVEAMSLGTPVVANELRVTNEVVSDAGILLPLEKKRWQQAIACLLADKALKQKFASIGPSQAATFSIKNMIDGYENACKQVLGPRT